MATPISDELRRQAREREARAREAASAERKVRERRRDVKLRVYLAEGDRQLGPSDR